MVERDKRGKFVKGHSFMKDKKRNPNSIQKMVITRRKNGSYQANGLRNKNTFTGKTYEELYGEEKAKQIKLKVGAKSLGRIPSNKGKTYEDFFGENKAKDLKEIIKYHRKYQITPMKDTKIEIKIQNFLKESKIEFYTHYYVSEITHSYQCDIFIPVQNSILQKTIIECDGDYWHGNPMKYSYPSEWQKKQIEEDIVRTKELQEKGFRVIRLWESDIEKMNINNFMEIL